MMVFRCSDPSCAAKEKIGGPVMTNTQGRFALALDSTQIAGARLIVEAGMPSDGAVRSAATVAPACGSGPDGMPMQNMSQSVTIAPVAGGVTDVPIDPITTAAL